MLREVLTVSALIVVVLLVRAIFKNRVPKRMIYALWLVVLLKLCLPGTLFSLPVLPAEDAAVPAQSAERPVQTAPVIQRPAQTVTKPQIPAQQPVSPVQETAKPAAKPLTTAQILQIAWFSGSALLGLWLFGTWLTFTIRLRKNRKFLGRRGKTNIYVSKRIKSPCLAGLIPAVYLTEDVLRNDTTELIVRHELTHLHHLDFLWSLCRTIAVIVYWWNPLIWLAAICSKRDAELACDEAVAARLPKSKRLAYARAILAQAPRKTAALSLAGPPVKERILFLTKKQRTSVLCVILALLLVVSATGCSFAELTRQKSGESTLPENAPVTAKPAATPEPADALIEQDDPAVLPVEQEAPGQEPPQLVNDGSYDTSQPLQDWELARTNGVQTGMTQAQVEAITGPLTENENGILMDSQNISYNFWDRSESESEPKLTEMIWIANVENDELVYTTSQDVPAFRGICLGDTINEVFDQFPCTDRELKRWETQYVYGYDGADDYAVLNFIADSFYMLSFYADGHWRASIDFSRVQLRAFQIQIYGETYWQDMSQAGEVMADRAQNMTLTVSSGEKYTLSDADTAAVEEIYSDDSMRPGGWESVCVYQFDIRNCSYRLDETFELAETIVRIDADHYEYYMKRLTRDESETMRTLIDRYRPNVLQPVRLRSVTADSVTAEHIILLSSYLEEDLQTLNDLYIPPEDYQYGYYYRRISDKTYTYTVAPDAPVTIYDISQVYGAGEDRLYTFENWQDFVTAVQADEGLLIQPYVLTIQNGVVTKLEEKFYN